MRHVTRATITVRLCWWALRKGEGFVLSDAWWAAGYVTQPKGGHRG